MKRIAKLILTGFLLGGLVVALSSCASNSAEGEELQNQTITVQRGDLTVDVTAVGNLALSRTENLAFDLFYQEGTVAEVLVEEGDTVEKGQVLARLDISEWADELSTLEDDVTTAERQLAAKQRDLIQADINLRNARTSLEKTNTTYDLVDYKVAQADVRDAEENLEDTLLIWSKYGEGTPGYYSYAAVVRQAQSRLDTAKDKLDDMISGFGTDDVEIKRLQVELAEGKLEDARMAITDAEKSLADAREALAEAKAKSPVITAPFAGFITKINVEGGDDVMTGTVAVQLADPEKFEADIMVSELDILQVRIGGTAWVTVDAMQGLRLPATVTHISPTATIQSGVVNYKVKVELESLDAVVQERQQAMQEQSEEMMRQRQERMPMMFPADFQLREGLTVTVSIIIDNKTGVLLVPNTAIGTQGRQTFVRVLDADGTVEQRTIQTGITDYQSTEVTDGLSEGEQVVVPQGTATTTTTQQQRQGGMFIPGMGRVR
ncbi:MAG: HlyD family efflux transporter periplasmic adaptor subunit [Dehalococcoidales bacterium]|nr:HlyD family efflux transporter periplasmic adaptor subunit [Dehalococcoidales bacterium]